MHTYCVERWRKCNLQASARLVHHTAHVTVRLLSPHPSYATWTPRAVEQAFKDLSALMASAAAMVALAEKFRGVLAAGAEAGAGGGGAGGEDPLLLDLETQQQLIALGISSPVTRETAGGLAGIVGVRGVGNDPYCARQEPAFVAV